MEIEELIVWLTENTNEWHLEVNPHEGTYETRESYVKYMSEPWDDTYNEGANFYELRAYPNTPVSQYLIFGTDLKKVLGMMKNAVEPHRKNGSKPMRLEKS